MSLTLKSKIDEIDIIHLKYNTRIAVALANTYEALSSGRNVTQLRYSTNTKMKVNFHKLLPHCPDNSKCIVPITAGFISYLNSY